jgi:hypothetical protein
VVVVVDGRVVVVVVRGGRVVVVVELVVEVVLVEELDVDVEVLLVDEVVAAVAEEVASAAGLTPVPSSQYAITRTCERDPSSSSAATGTCSVACRCDDVDPVSGGDAASVPSIWTYHAAWHASKPSPLTVIVSPGAASAGSIPSVGAAGPSSSSGGGAGKSAASRSARAWLMNRCQICAGRPPPVIGRPLASLIGIDPSGLPSHTTAVKPGT